MKESNFMMMLFSGVLMLACGMIIVTLLVIGENVCTEVITFIISFYTFVYTYTNRNKFD